MGSERKIYQMCALFLAGMAVLVEAVVVHSDNLMLFFARSLTVTPVRSCYLSICWDPDIVTDILYLYLLILRGMFSLVMLLYIFVKRWYPVRAGAGGAVGARARVVQTPYRLLLYLNLLLSLKILHIPIAIANFSRIYELYLTRLTLFAACAIIMLLFTSRFQQGYQYGHIAFGAEEESGSGHVNTGSKGGGVQIGRRTYTVTGLLVAFIVSYLIPVEHFLLLPNLFNQIGLLSYLQTFLVAVYLLTIIDAVRRYSKERVGEHLCAAAAVALIGFDLQLQFLVFENPAIQVAGLLAMYLGYSLLLPPSPSRSLQNAAPPAAAGAAASGGSRHRPRAQGKGTRP